MTDEEVTEIIQDMTKAMIETEEILDKGHMIETEQGILDSEADPEVSIIQESHTEDNYRKRCDSRQHRLRSQSRSPATRLRAASRSQSRDKDRLVKVSNFV